MPDQSQPEPKGDLVQIGASPATRDILDNLQETGHIDDLMDGYRLAVAVAIAFGRQPRTSAPATPRRIMFAVGNLDQDNSLRQTIAEIYPEVREIPSRAMEDLAEQGLDILADSMTGDELSFADLMVRVNAANE